MPKVAQLALFRRVSAAIRRARIW